MTEQNTRLTWDCLVELEPQLHTIEVMARSITNNDGDCPLSMWLGDVTTQLRRAIGGRRRKFHPVLSREDAYEVAYGHLYKQLPVCGTCPMCQEGE